VPAPWRSATAPSVLWQEAAPPCWCWGPPPRRGDLGRGSNRPTSVTRARTRAHAHAHAHRGACMSRRAMAAARGLRQQACVGCSAHGGRRSLGPFCSVQRREPPVAQSRRQRLHASSTGPCCADIARACHAAVLVTAGRSRLTNGCLNDAPCPPCTSHGASIRQPFGAAAGRSRLTMPPRVSAWAADRRRTSTPTARSI
jgi:hypothetical protein